MNPEQMLAALDAERAELLTKANETPEAWTDADASRADEVVKEMNTLRESIAKRAEASKRLASVGGGVTNDAPSSDDDEPTLKGGLGDRLVASKAWKTFQKSTEDHRGVRMPVDGKPVSVKAEKLGALVAKADPAPLSSTLGGAVQYVRQPGIVDLTYPKRPTLLDLVTMGTTESSYLEYRTLIAVTSGAGVVQEGGLKGLSTLSTSVANAAAYVLADGVKVTNQELADDGVIAALLNSVLTRNIWAKLEDLLLNGSGTNEPRGILNTTGVLNEAFSTDLVTTARKAITTLRNTSDTDAVAFILNPEDDEQLDLLQDDQGRFYGNGPFGIGPGTLWGRPRIVSQKIPAGKFLTGDLASVQILEREGLSIQAFNQNEDDARHNLTYIRAEARELILIREPARILVGASKGA